MSSIQKEALVGVFVLVGVGAFVAGTLWLRGKSVGTDDVYVVYENIATLKDASSVRISGAQVGRVEGIHYLAPGRVVVGLKFDKSLHIQVSSAATAVVTAVGMLGDYMVVLDPGKGTPLAKGDTIRGTLSAGVVDKAGNLADQATQMMTRVNAMLDTQLVVELRHTLAASRQFMSYLADQKNGPAAQIGPTMTSLKAATERLDSTLAQVNPRLVQSRLDTTLRSAGDAANRLAATAARADSLMQRIEHGNGTMAMLMNDSTMYGDLRKTLQAFTDLLNEIKKNPGKIGITVRVPF
jgi:phospholipid/cholesterol/gamma-HCH transport system substrate-binding protein